MDQGDDRGTQSHSGVQRMSDTLVLSTPLISIVVPAYNEAEGLAELHTRVSRVMDELGEPWELVLVNDGSSDDTLVTMEQLRSTDPHVAVVNLSRNFGKEIATTAGLDFARGEAVVILDADLGRKAHPRKTAR